MEKAESKILKTIDPCHGSCLYELASRAAMLPRDVRRAVDRLCDRGRVTMSRDGTLVSLARPPRPRSERETQTLSSAIDAAIQKAAANGGVEWSR